MKYIVVQSMIAFDTDTLANNLYNDVNEKIKEGWRPLGGAFKDHDNFYQTMVREEAE